ncbi:MAG: S1 RNA-binding domain-containing protein [Phycisphaerae bacterium]
MKIDPHDFDSESLNQAMKEQLGEVSPEEIQRMAAGQSPPPHAGGEGNPGRGKINGRIIEVRGGDVFVDIGGKAEAFLPLDEFEGDHKPAPGEMHVFVMQGLDQESGQMRLSLREARTDADFSTLQVGDVIEARVTGMNVGGLELQAKGLKAFMPKSQVDVHRIEDFTPFIGRRMDCEVSEVDRKGKRIVVSRRKVLERERAAQRVEIRKTLEVGQVKKGVVRRLTEFGAFVDIGGVEGLLHVGEISFARVNHAKDVLKEGDEIEVKILKIDFDKDRISLSTKAMQPDPWNVVPANYRQGQQADGKVTKLMDFGAFVELEPGVEGLIPVSEISWTQRIRHPRDVLKEGDSVRVSILLVDPDKRKITMSLKALSTDPWMGIGDRYTPDIVVSGVVMRLAEFGAFIQLEEGVEGLVHISEMSDKRIRTPGDVCKVGDVVKVRVKSVDAEQKRVSLSMKLEVAQAATEADIAAATGGGHATQAPAAKKRKKALKGGLE